LRALYRYPASKEAPMTDFNDVKTDVGMPAYYVQLPLDEDGTPMVYGERLVEVEPGKWKHPDTILAEEFLSREVAQ
jgi:hypothetical protein